VLNDDYDLTMLDVSPPGIDVMRITGVDAVAKK